MARSANRCRWLGLEDALTLFAYPTGKTQSQAHIRPLHWYVACRLVVEGGFLPDEITPRPPFEARRQRRQWLLEHAPARGGSGEQTVIGGLKTKDVDVTVAKRDIGPCLAVSVKGTLNAFRNLTNRMEEAVGDCTNLHIAYPNLVYGFLHLLRGNREGLRSHDEASVVHAAPDGAVRSNDIAIRRDGVVVDSIRRYHDVLLGLTGRRGIRNDITRYESLALTLIQPRPVAVAREWPPPDSPLRFESLFTTLYREYDQRYVFAAPKLAKRTHRVVWSEASPALDEGMRLDYEPRTGADATG